MATKGLYLQVATTVEKAAPYVKLSVFGKDIHTYQVKFNRCNDFYLQILIPVCASQCSYLHQFQYFLLHIWLPHLYSRNIACVSKNASIYVKKLVAIDLYTPFITIL